MKIVITVHGLTEDEERWGKLDRIGATAILEIRRRCRKGVDYQLQPFKPYSKAYTKQLKKQGQSIRPDLELSGNMLDALSKEVLERKNQVCIFFDNDADDKKAYYTSVHGVGKEKVVREFFNMTFRDINIFLRELGPGHRISITRFLEPRTPLPITDVQAPTLKTEKKRPGFSLTVRGGRG